MLAVIRKDGIMVYANPWANFLNPGKLFVVKASDGQDKTEWFFCGTLLKEKISAPVTKRSPGAGICVTGGPRGKIGVVTQMLKDDRVKAVVLGDRFCTRLPRVLGRTRGVLISELLTPRLRTEFSVYN